MNIPKLLIIGSGHLVGEHLFKIFAQKYNITFIDYSWPVIDAQIQFLKSKPDNYGKTLSGLAGMNFDAVMYLSSMVTRCSKETEPEINLESLYQALEFATNEGIGKFIYASGNCVSGFTSHKVDYKPLYIPIDEEHPCLPHEPYGLIKWFGELLCEQYSRAYGIECVCLRFAQIDFSLKSQQTTSDIDDEKNWFKSHVRIENVLQALELSLNYSMNLMEVPCKSFYISDSETYLLQNSLDFIRIIYPEMPPPVKDLSYFANNPKGTLFSNHLAIKELGYNPELFKRHKENIVAY
jgi:dTDP-4-dehydrorhamnose reductase